MFGDMVRAHRGRLGITQEELADRSGVSVRGLGKIEAGRIGRPRPSTVRLLADAFGLSGAERDRFCAAAGPKPAPETVGEPTRRPAPAQLPPDVAGFTGRAEQLRELDLLLDQGDEQPTAVVITAIAGAAGVGKTALAVRWAHRVRARFPDGQLYVNLRGYAPTPPLRPIEALAQFLHALGVGAEEVPTDEAETAAMYRTLLADKRLLVVLDNARHADQVRPLLPASPGCLVLVSSRDRLLGLVARDGARRLTLDVLSPAEAHQLLSRILGPDRVAGEAAATAELARVCGLLPLALRIAAANLLDQPGRGIADYLAELTQTGRLAGLAVDGDPEAAVRTAFDTSYAVLDPDDRRMFRLLGLVPGPEVTAAAAAALAAVPLRRAARLLERLAGAHLLEPRAPGRFGFHDLLRLYARQRTQQEDEAEARQAALGRLLDWYLQVADAAARLLYPEKTRLPLPPLNLQPPQVGLADRAHALAWLDAERPNLVAAVQYAADHGPHPAAWLIADTLRGYLVLGRFPSEWLAVARAGLAAAEADDQPRAQAAAYLSLADLGVVQSRYEQATRDYLRALPLARRAEWLHGEAAALGNLGMVYQQSGRLQEASEHHARALALDIQTGSLAGQAVNLGNLGLLSWLMGRLAQAADYDLRALALYRETGSSYGEALTLSNLGMAYHALGRFDDALEHLTQALALQREVGDRGNEGDTLQGLAAVHRDAGRCRVALELAEAALAVAQDTGDRVVEADARHVLASVHLHLGDHQLAAARGQEALQLAVETGEGYCEVGARIGLAQVHQRLGRPDQALAHARQACAHAGQAGYRLLEGQALTTLASIQLDRDQPHRAVEHASHALRIQREVGHRLGQAHTLLILGHALGSEGADAALSPWQQALALFTELGSPEADHAHALVRSCAAADHQ